MSGVNAEHGAGDAKHRSLHKIYETEAEKGSIVVLPIYYINLARRTDRRAFMEEQLARLGLTGTRIEAVRPDDISPSDRARYCDRGKPRFLRENELACTLSHERAWRKLLEDGHDRGIFLEDDAYFSSLFPGVVDYLSTQPFDLVRLEAVGKKTRVLPPVASAGEIVFRPFRTTTLGAAAYLLTADAVRDIIDDETLRRVPVDVALYSPFVQPGRRLRSVLADPALCVQLAKPAAEGRQSVVGKSDIQASGEPHTYALKFPVRHRLSVIAHNVAESVRNVTDHLLHLPRGLSYRPIVFKGGPDQISRIDP